MRASAQMRHKNNDIDVSYLFSWWCHHRFSFLLILCVFGVDRIAIIYHFIWKVTKTVQHSIRFVRRWKLISVTHSIPLSRLSQSLYRYRSKIKPIFISMIYFWITFFLLPGGVGINMLLWFFELEISTAIANRCDKFMYACTTLCIWES